MLAYCFPLTYAVEAVRDAAVRGFGILAVWPDLAALVAFLAVGLLLAAISVRRAA